VVAASRFKKSPAFLSEIAVRNKDKSEAKKFSGIYA
jgi:hypothetical protein